MAAHYHNRPVTLLDLPREIIRTIAGCIYDPLEITQQDRLTWGIFSTVDMHQQRQDDLESLVRFGWTCRRVRREVRVILFRCIRAPTRWHAEEVVRNAAGWARFVKSIIIDLSMFDEDPTTPTPDPDLDSSPTRAPHSANLPPYRSCWSESTTLINLFNSLPSLEHVSFFADASDDITLALTFAALVPHPSPHAIPPSTILTSPAFSTHSIPSPLAGHARPVSPTPMNHLGPTATTFTPLAHRLKSFGWRQRACAPSPASHRSFHQTSIFVSTLHLLRHAYRLSFLVLDADMDELQSQDVLAVLKELSLREVPLGEEAARVSLMLCGPISGWTDPFRPKRFAGSFMDVVGPKLYLVKELFLDRPLRKSNQQYVVSEGDFLDVLQPLFQHTPHLHLLQVGSYIFSPETQLSIAKQIAKDLRSLLVLGLNGQEGDTMWWGIWRSGTRGVASADSRVDVEVRPLEEGDLRRLEDGLARTRGEDVGFGIDLVV